MTLGQKYIDTHIRCEPRVDDEDYAAEKCGKYAHIVGCVAGRLPESFQVIVERSRHCTIALSSRHRTANQMGNDVMAWDRLSGWRMCTDG